LNHRVTELTQINRELEAFSYSISHDLRAPLRSMEGFAQALLDDDCVSRLGQEAEDYVHRIVASSQYMDRLLADLLEYSRLSHAEVNAAPVPLEVALNEVLDHFSAEVSRRQADIQVDRPLHTILAHRPTLQQVLTNLLANAIKFVDPSRNPGIHIWSREEAGRVKLWIEDNGIGIAPEHQEKIFNLFERLHGNNAYPGTGVGLALVRKGTERMAGLVGLESQPGQGSRFWLELPAAPHGR
jgi:signal transduction histidine kinase